MALGEDAARGRALSGWGAAVLDVLKRSKPKEPERQAQFGPFCSGNTAASGDGLSLPRSSAARVSAANFRIVSAARHTPTARMSNANGATHTNANGVIHTSPWATPRVHPPKQIGALKAPAHHLSIPGVKRWAKSRSSPLVCNDQRRMERTGFVKLFSGLKALPPTKLRRPGSLHSALARIACEHREPN